MPESDPEEFEMYEYAAQDFDLHTRGIWLAYLRRGWAAPISGDATTLRLHRDQ